MVYTCIYCIVCIYATTRSENISIYIYISYMYDMGYTHEIYWNMSWWYRQFLCVDKWWQLMIKMKAESIFQLNTCEHPGWLILMVNILGINIHDYSPTGVMAANRRFHPLKIPNKPGPPPLRGCAMCGSRSSRQPWRSRNFENRHRTILHGVSWVHLAASQRERNKVSYHFKSKCLAVQEPWWV